jgi:hypothetical protein
MAEWLKAAVLKTASPKGDVGSNPTPSAMHHVGCMAAVYLTWYTAPRFMNHIKSSNEFGVQSSENQKISLLVTPNAELRTPN